MLELEVSIDGVGNVVGRWDVGDGAPVMMGSHVDTVRTGGRYDGNYDDAALAVYAREIESYLESGLDAYVYFNNDLHGHALKNAASLKALLQKHTKVS